MNEPIDDLIERFQNGERSDELLEQIAQAMIEEIRKNRKQTIYDYDFPDEPGWMVK